MECSCEFETCCEDGEQGKLVSDYIRKAIKQHECCECQRVIDKGETYRAYGGFWDGKYDIYKTCSDCMSLYLQFFKGGYIFTTLREEIANNINDCDGEIPESCISELTPLAREFVCKEIEYYWDK